MTPQGLLSDAVLQHPMVGPTSPNNMLAELNKVEMFGVLALGIKVDIFKGVSPTANSIYTTTNLPPIISQRTDMGTASSRPYISHTYSNQDYMWYHWTNLTTPLGSANLSVPILRVAQIASTTGTSQIGNAFIRTHWTFKNCNPITLQPFMMTEEDRVYEAATSDNAHFQKRKAEFYKAIKVKRIKDLTLPVSDSQRA